MSKKTAPKREKKGSSWMDTYGDLVTLLLTFFVMLFASSTLNEAKWQQIVQAFTGSVPGVLVQPIDPLNPTMALGDTDGVPGRQNASSAMTVEQTEEQAQIQQQFEELYRQLEDYINSRGLSNAIGLATSEDGRYINITVIEGILFDSGLANIRDAEAEQLLTDIGNMLKLYESSIQRIDVVGHTDNVPIAETNPNYVDNRDLSSERANNVVRWMEVNSGITPSLITGTGEGEYHPVAPNDTPENRQKNRRVEFEIESKQVVGGAPDFSMEEQA